jgi:putative acetyltransferase
MSEPASITVRRETPADIDAVRRVETAAFGRVEEADLVDALRDAGDLLLSLVAELDGEVIGHIGFSPMTIESPGRSHASICLAPVAVVPERQKQGVGSRLIESGLAELRQMGVTGVILQGHPSYYPRFGFRPARLFDIHREDDRDSFMALELVLGAFDGVSGSAHFAPAFSTLE